MLEIKSDDIVGKVVELCDRLSAAPHDEGAFDLGIQRDLRHVEHIGG